jgi:membrane associated rhomboid family serine protease
LVQAAVGSHCVECAKAAKPDAKTRAKYWSARQPSLVTTTLIVINLLAFVYLVLRDVQALSGTSITIGHAQLGLFPGGLADGHPQAVSLPDGAVYVTDGGQWYRLITSGFIHFGIIHLALNMYILYQLGNMIEPAIGRIRFLLVYIASLLGGSALQLVLDGGGIAAGASGAVFGLMGFAAVGYWQRGINPLTTNLGALLLMNLFLTFVVANIGVGAHIGGAIAGALCAIAVAAPGHKGVPRWATYATPIGVGALSVVIAAWAVA